MPYKARKGSKFKPFQRKLTPTMAARLVADVRVHKMSQRKAAEKYGINPSTVRMYLRPELRGEPAELPKCGTNAAYQRHLYHNELADDACVEAHNRDRRKRTTERERERNRIAAQKRRDALKAAGIKEWDRRTPKYKAQDAQRHRERRAALKQDPVKYAAFLEANREYRRKKKEEKEKQNAGK